MDSSAKDRDNPAPSLATWCKRDGVFLNIRILKQAEFEFVDEYATDSLVEYALIKSTSFNLANKVRPVTDDRGQLHIKACIDCQDSSLDRSCSYVLSSGEPFDSAVIRHDATFETHPPAQEVREVSFTCTHRDPVNLRVGIHDAPQARKLDRRFEWGGIHVVQFSLPELCRGHVLPRLSHGVAEEVLRGCKNAL